jgi:hypothetical protein
MRYLDVQAFFDADYPAHVMRYYWKSHFLRELPAEAIATMVELNERAPSPHSTLDLWQLGVPSPASAHRTPRSGTAPRRS